MIKKALAIGLILAGVVNGDDRIERNTTFANGVTVKTESGVHVIAQPGSVWDLHLGTVIGTPISQVAWSAITGTVPNISTFPNDAGYLNSNSVPVPSFNGRTGGITLLYADVLNALGFTPADETNPHGYINAGQAPVQSVAGHTGMIVLTLNDVTGLVSVLTDKQDAISTASVAISAPLTGFTAGTGTVTSADTVLTALQKHDAAIATNTSSISSNTSAIATKEASANKGAANGYAPLDSGSKLPVANLTAVAARTDAANDFGTNAQYLSLIDGGGGVYNVKRPRVGNFARQDGSTDDRNAFLSTADAAVTDGGRILYAPGGANPYIIANATSAFDVSRFNGLTIRGDGATSTIFKRGTAGAMFFTNTGSTLIRITFEDIGFDGNVPAMDGNYGEFTFGPNVVAIFRRCRFTNMPNFLVSATASTVTFEDCVVDDPANAHTMALQLKGGSRAYVRRCEFNYVYGGVVQADADFTSGVEIEDSRFFGGCWWMKAVQSGNGSTATYDATHLYESAGTLNIYANRRSELSGISTTTTAPTLAGGTTITVASTTAFPPAPSTLQVNGNIINYSAKTGTTFTVTGADVVSNIASGQFISSTTSPPLPGQLIVAKTTKATSTITASSGEFGITDNSTDFTSGGVDVRVGDFITSGSIDGIVTAVTGTHDLRVRRWENDTTRQRSAAPLAGAPYTIQKRWYGHEGGFLGGGLSSSSAIIVDQWTDFQGNVSTPPNGTPYEVLYLPNYQSVFAYVNSYHWKLHGNTFESSNSDANGLNNGSGHIVDNNHYLDNHDTAITVQASNCIISNNKITHTGSNGIAVIGNENLVIGNEIKDTGWVTGTLSASDIHISNLAGSYSPSRNTVTDNKCIGDSITQAKHGILLSATTGSTASTGNIVTHNTSTGHAMGEIDFFGTTLLTGNKLFDNVGAIQNAPTSAGTLVAGVPTGNTTASTVNDTPAVSHQFATAFTASTGVLTLAQPASTDLSDVASVVKNITLNTPNLLFASGNTATVSGSTATITMSLNTQAAHTYLAGPISGSSANPTMRTIDVTDLPDPTTLVDLKEEFISGSNATGALGALGWGLSGTPTWIGVTGHPGVIEQTTTTASGTNVWIRLGATSASISGQDSFDVTWIARLNTNDANTTTRLGLAGTFSSGSSPSDGAYFEKLDADTDWFVVNRASGTQTRTDTGIAVGTDWVKLRIRRINSTNVGYTINGGTETVVASNSPTVTLNVGAQLVNSAAAAKTIDYDYCRVLITGLSR